jgi:hypothetical protein
LAVVKSAPMNIGVKASFQNTDFVSFEYIPGAENYGSHGSFIFKLLRYLYIIFHNGCTNLYSQHQCAKVPFYPHACQHWLSFVFLMINHQTNVK